MTIQRNTLVKRLSDGGIFRVVKVNNNGTITAKWVDQFVPLVEVFLYLDEVEEIG